MKRWGYALLLGLLVMFCADRITPTNSYDPEFTGGNYALSFHWSVGDVTDSTIIPFVIYNFYCRNEGDPGFQSFTYSITPDSGTPAVSFVSDERYDFDPGVPLGPFSTNGSYTLSIIARKLNGNDTTVTIPITVVNPYRIVCDSSDLYPDNTLNYYIVNTCENCPAPADSHLTARWFVDSVASVTPSRYDTFTVQVQSGDTVAISAQLLEKDGIRLRLDTVQIVVPQVAVPAVHFDKNIWYVSQGDSNPITAKTSETAKLQWEIDSMGTIDTVITTTPSLVKYWGDTNSVSIVVTPFNSKGKAGTSASIIVRPRSYRYDLRFSDFPDIIPVRDTVTWKVTAYEADTVVADENITYVWTIDPPDDYDTIIDNGTCSIYCSDSIAPFTLSVVAVSDTDSSWTVDANVTVRTWRPGIVLLESHNSTRINETLTFVVNTWDTDSSSGGYIAERFYRTSFGDTDTQSFTDDTLSFKMTAAGSHSIQFWCIDNKNLSSDTLITWVQVTSDKPYFNQASENHITTFAGDTVHFTVNGLPGDNPGSTITDYIWTSKGGTRSDTTPVNQYSLVFSEACRDTVVVLCRNSENEVSKDPVKFFITVSLGLPVVDSVICAERTGFIGDSVDLAIAAHDSNGTLVAIVVHADTGNFADDTIAVDPADSIFNDTIRLPLTDTGTIRFFVTAIDDEGYTSEAKRMSTPLKVTLGRPRVTSITPKTCWVFDDTTFSVTAADSNSSGSIDTIRVQWESGGTWQSFSRSQTPHYRYTTPGVKQVRIVAVDNQGYASSQYSTSITVNRGTPAVDVDFQATVWIKDSEQYTVNGSDDNGDIVLRGIRWDDVDTFKTSSIDGNFSHEFNDSGSHSFEVFVVDDDGISSDTVRQIVRVDLGQPSITQVLASDPGFDELYIGDTIRFTVAISDPNNENRQVKVSWNGDQVFEDSTTVAGNSVQFRRKYLKADSGSHTVRFRVIDADGLTDDEQYNFTLLAGAPEVHLISLVPVIATDSFFVNDTIRFHLAVSDTNGSIRNIAINWNGGTSAEQTIALSGSVNSVDTAFYKSYDTTGGSYRIRAWAVDEDTVVSRMIDTTITIQKGAPVLSADAGDTLWVVVDKGVGTIYPIHINHSDPNGSIVYYYWNESGPSLGRRTTTDTIMRNFSAGDMVVPFDMWIYGKDDDSLVRGGKFLVFADSAPPRPASLISSSVSDSTIFKWEKVADNKDGQKTQIQIYISEGNTGEPDQPLFSEPLPTLNDARFGEETISTLHATYTFKCPFSGLGRWRIVLQDARGSETVAPNTAGDPASFVAP